MAKTRKSRRQPLSISSLVRKQGNRQPRKCVLIMCVGTETEPNYFCALRRELKLTTVEVRVEGKRLDCLRVVDCAITAVEDAKRNGQPLDEVWCVFDVENPRDNPQLGVAVNKARTNKIELAISNPAFEYWYLLHFKETDRPFRDATDLFNSLRDADCLPDYEKNSSVFDELYQYTAIASKRAARILKNHPDKSTEFPNPSTLVFRLVESLQNMSEYK
jgi:hypothetical protein